MTLDPSIIKNIKVVPVSLYLDVWPGFDPKSCLATATPYQTKEPNNRRYRIDVMVPDPVMESVDGVLPAIVTGERPTCPNC